MSTAAARTRASYHRSATGDSSPSCAPSSSEPCTTACSACTLVGAGRWLYRSRPLKKRSGRALPSVTSCSPISVISWTPPTFFCTTKASLLRCCSLWDLRGRPGQHMFQTTRIYYLNSLNMYELAIELENSPPLRAGCGRWVWSQLSPVPFSGPPPPAPPDLAASASGLQQGSPLVATNHHVSHMRWRQ